MTLIGRVCLLHVEQIKRALGISGVLCDVRAWRSRQTQPGAQIDLLIDRPDGIVNVCECKYADTPFDIDSAYRESLLNKLEAFRNEAKCHKALHLTMIAPGGVARNAYSDVVVNELGADALFL